MFGSYGSYSSTLSSNSSYISQPLDITYSTSSSSSCAYPSWPRRSSLSESDSGSDGRPSSYLSDDDLLFLPDPFEDDARSISSGSEGIPTPPAMNSPRQHMIDEAELMEMESKRAAMKKEFVRQVMIEKERRRQASKGKKSSSSRSSKKSGSPKSKLSSMTPISEV